MAHLAIDADAYATPRQNIFYPGVTPDLDGQCVSLAKGFLQDMTDVPDPQAARGDARYVGKNLVAQGHAVEVPYSERKRGDLICYEYGTYGHIGVVLSGDRTFEENVNWAGVDRKLVDGAYVYASRIGSLSESWRHDQHIYRVNTYKEGNQMNADQAAELALYIRLLAFETVEEANSHSKDDVAHMLADPAYAAAIAKAVYSGEWQLPAYKAGHYDSDTKSSYNKGYADGQATAGGGSLPVGTYLKVDKANVIEVKGTK